MCLLSRDADAKKKTPQAFEKGCTWGDLSGPPSQYRPFDGVDEPRNRLGALSCLEGTSDDGCRRVRVPAPPAVDIAGELNPVQRLPWGKGKEPVPVALGQPLLKTAQGQYFGIGSGSDSVLLSPQGKKWFRCALVSMSLSRSRW